MFDNKEDKIGMIKDYIKIINKINYYNKEEDLFDCTEYAIYELELLDDNRKNSHENILTSNNLQGKEKETTEIIERVLSKYLKNPEKMKTREIIECANLILNEIFELVLS